MKCKSLGQQHQTCWTASNQGPDARPLSSTCIVKINTGERRSKWSKARVSAMTGGSCPPDIISYFLPAHLLNMKTHTTHTHGHISTSIPLLLYHCLQEGIKEWSCAKWCCLDSDQIPLLPWPSLLKWSMPEVCSLHHNSVPSHHLGCCHHHCHIHNSVGDCLSCGYNASAVSSGVLPKFYNFLPLSLHHKNFLAWIIATQENMGADAKCCCFCWWSGS